MSGANANRTSAEVMSADSVIRCVADDDELRWLKFDVQVRVNSLSRDPSEVTSIEGVITVSARQIEVI